MDQIDFDIIDLSIETDFTQQFYCGHLFLVLARQFQSLEIRVFSTKYVKWSLCAFHIIAEHIYCLMYGVEILFQSLEMP